MESLTDFELNSTLLNYKDIGGTELLKRDKTKTKAPTTKPQLKAYLEPELFRQYEEAAREYGFGTPSSVAADVLRRCLPIWRKAEDAKAQTLASSVTT